MRPKRFWTELNHVARDGRADQALAQQLAPRAPDRPCRAGLARKKTRGSTRRRCGSVCPAVRRGAEPWAAALTMTVVPLMQRASIAIRVDRSIDVYADAAGSACAR